MMLLMVILPRVSNIIFAYSSPWLRICMQKGVVNRNLITRCMPILLYSLEAFSLYNYQLKSLDFVITRFFMKLFRTSNIHVVSDCQEQFNFVLPSVQLARRAKKFANKLNVN